MTEPTPPVPSSTPAPAPTPAPGYSQQPYVGQPTPYGAPGYAPAAPTNTLAIISLIAAFVLAPAAIICGHIALGQIKRTGESGHGLAFAGLVLGYVFTGFAVLGIIAYIIFFIVLFSTYGATGLTVN
jgi:Domain of unknown function (DUF4190)